MSDEGEAALTAVRRLPEQAVAGLREAFAAEVAERLPRLHAALAAGRPADALRDAHTLGSSALVVGEPGVGRAARAAEAAMLAGEPAAEHVAELAALLDRWTP
ncbi:MAG TPA: Hpt domain-containing protein [Mycobacteriales bacterium]|nr:Hpt domain-containing protein [Mycobacteriales bacterium]